MRRNALAVFILAAGLVSAIGGARADDDDQPSLDEIPHITVVGAAAAAVVPDQAEIRVGVSVEKATAQEAWEEDARRIKDVIDAAKAAGVKPQDIATEGVDLFQQNELVRQPDGTSHSVPKGFRATQRLRLRFTQLDRIGSLTGTLIAKGADTFGGVSFSVARPETIQDKLRGDAVRDARHQAEILAAAAGAKLGRLLTIERQGQPVAVRPAMQLRNAGPATMDLEPGTQTLSAEVQASWAIE